MVVGIDVSRYQGNIDWTKAAKGQNFVLIRAGYGKYTNQEDACFKQNVEGAYKNGLPIGVYWYSYAVSAAEAKKEAETCLEVIKPCRDKITLPVFFDQEYEPGILALSKAVRTDCCVAFCEAVEKAGYTPGMYASQDWFQGKITSSKLPKNTVLWVAKYSSTAPSVKYHIWQYSSSGSVPGITGRVDLNRGEFPAVTKDGWQKSGVNWYYYENGQPVKSAWRKITGTNGTFWYYLGKDGVMLTGLQKINNKLYMLNPSASNGVPEGACIITDKDGVIG